ncbi:MAG TPA: GNAT family N-acetyltransferase [Acidimicrobiia bacterium]
MDWQYEASTEFGDMICRPLTSDRFADMKEVFGDKGVARGCFCMHWRRPDGGYTDERDNMERFAAVISDEHPPGLIGYIESGPVGWVQVGPRSDFPTLQRSKLLAAADDRLVWSINCFVVRTGHRKQGVGRGLLASAIEFARFRGGETVEAYPVDGKRSSSVDYFTGTMSMFDSIGFTEVIRRNETRPMVRLDL